MIEEELTLAVIGFSLAATASSALLKGRVKASSITSSTLNSVASALMIYLGLSNLILNLGRPSTFTLLRNAPSPPSNLVLGYDWLTSVMVSLLGFVSLMVSVYSGRHFIHYGREGDVRGLTSVLPIFTLSMFLVLTARDLLWFFIFWEVMTISSLALVLYEHGESEVRFSGILYAATMHVGALSLLVGLFMLASLTPTHSLLYSSIASSARELVGNPLTYVALSLITAGFLFKAGITPLHLWLPDAHSVAPSNVSALLSGLMVKMGVYGIIRYALIILAPCVNQVFALALMGLAALSVAVGAAYAAVQNDYKRLLAYSTVENVGIIMLAVSAASLGLTYGVKWLYCLGIAAALFHTVNHSVFKSLMFLNAGTILRVTGTRNLNEISGLAGKLKASSITSLIGSLSASAMPPLNGFASKFIVYETLLLVNAALTTWYLRLASLLSVAALILSGVLTMIAFTKFYGSAFLGKYSGIKLRGSESGAELAATITLSVACVALALASPVVMHGLLRIQHLNVAPPAVSYFGVILSVGAGVWRFPAAASYIMLSIALAIAFTASLSTYGKGLRRGEAEPFISGVKYVESVHRPKADMLTQLIRDYLAGMLGVRKSVKREYLIKHWTSRRVEYEVRFGRHLISKSLRLREAGEFFERVFYAPPYRFFKWFGGWFKNLQSGNLLLYIAYIYIAYIILLGLILWLR